MKQDLPLVSVVVPAYNAEKFIEDAIASVLMQDYANIELLLIDDGSSDNTFNILKKHEDGERVKVLQHDHGENRGVSKTRKLGIDHANGEFIAFLDADDLFFPLKISKQVQVLLSDTSLVVVHSNAFLINETDYDFKNEFKFDVKDQPYDYKEHSNWLTSNHICNSTVLISKKHITSIKFDFQQAFQFEDWLIWSLMAFKGKFHFISEPLAYYRLHENSATAVILKQNLFNHYSRIEFLLALYSLVNLGEEEFDKQLVIELKSTLVNLIKCYDVDGDKAKKFASTIHVDGEEGHLEKEYYNLLQSHQNLLELYNENKNFKQSRVYKLYQFFKK